MVGGVYSNIWMHMAKPNYGFAKRQRELAKKQKKEEKRQRKAGSNPEQEQDQDQTPAEPGTQQQTDANNTGTV